MRTIKFRGKDLDTNEWVYGDLLHAIDYDPDTRKGVYGKGYIIHEKGDENDEFVCRSTDIDPNTVGQFTGLKDCEDREIFEGDIIEVILQHNRETASTYKAVVYQKEGAFGFGNKQGFAPFYGQTYEKFKVVGNIHDNPDMMKGGAL